MKLIFFQMLTVVTLILTFVYPVSSKIYSMAFAGQAMSYIYIQDVFVFKQVLNTERQICMRYGELATMLSDTAVHLFRPFRSFNRDLSVVKGISKGRYTEGCFNYISEHLSEEVHAESGKYEKCTLERPPDHIRLAGSLATIVAAYEDKKNMTLKRIKRCAYTMPNEPQENRRRFCVSKYLSRFNEFTKAMLEKLTPSPCMVNFRDTMLRCLDNAMVAISKVDAGLNDLIKLCMDLSPVNTLKEKFPLFRNRSHFTPMLFEQLKEAQENYQVVLNEESNIDTSYFDWGRRLMEEYDVKHRDASYFKELVSKKLHPYYEAIEKSLNTNKLEGNAVCGDEAKKGINTILEKSVRDYQVCGQNVINNTLTYMNSITDEISAIKHEVPEVEFGAVIECMKNGLFLVKDGIRQCYNLKLRRFSLLWHTSTEEMKKAYEKLKTELDSFMRPNNIMPCGERYVKQIILDADITLNTYTKCMYKATGTDYVVTIA